MNYKEALEYIHTTYRFGRKLGLENISKLLELLGKPQEKLNIIHVAGTNGKGSTCSFISRILQEGGYKVGLYTSPFLETFNERIRINGEDIKDDDLGRVTAIVKEKADEMVASGYNHPTEFEIVTAIAFYYYYEQAVDYLVLEVGMGGRFDATNVIRPLLSVITSISLDHIDYLGDTLGKIAYEKAGIIKENIPLVLYPQEKEAESVIEEVAASKNALVYKVNSDQIKIKETSLEGQTFEIPEFGELKTSLIGEHQVKNAFTAFTAISLLRKNGVKLEDEAIRRGIENTRWAGRLELMKKNPTIIIDGAHNEEGAQALGRAIDDYMGDKNIKLVLGMLSDKDVDKVTSILVPRVKSVIATVPDSDRALSVDELKAKILKFEKEVISIPNISDAVDYSIKESNKDDVIIFAGSLYMIGEVRSILKKLI